FIPFTTSAYSPVTTHAGLTEQIVEFYNLSSGAKTIGNSDMELMVDASINEDFFTRPLNHFYDPIRNIGINGARSSKVWALDGNVVENDFSWPKAIQAYAEGKDALAMLGLGHILHLIEDLSVPDHTRNDPHKGDGLENGFTGESPYEKWADGAKNRSTLRGLARDYITSGNKMYHFADLGQAFDFLANYSNHNFFSRDTIVNSIYHYEYPKIEIFDGIYGYGTDGLTGEKLKLVISTRDADNNRVLLLGDKTNSSVLSSYFDRLAKQAVLTGAGVIELFFKEGEKTRADYKIAQAKIQQEEIAKNNALAKELASKSYIGLAVAGAGMLWNQYVAEPITNTTTQVTGTITRGATNINQATQHYSAFIFSSGAIAVEQGKEIAAKEISKAKDTIVSATNQISTVIRQTISQNVDGNLQVANASETSLVPVKSTAVVAISEIKLSEPVQKTALPVFEKTTKEVVLAPSFSSGGGGHVSTQEPISVQPEVVAILEVATTTSILSTVALTVSECANSFVSDICAIATTTAHVSWQASTTPDHFQLTLSGSQNETATTTDDNAEVTLSGDGEYTFLIEAYAHATSTAPYASSTQNVSVIQNPLVINEIAWSGTTASSSDQWIELYNNSSHTVNLSKFRIASPDSDFAISLSGTVASHGYALLERGSDQSVQNVSADSIYEATSTSLLPDIGTSLSLFWGDTRIDQTPEVTYLGWTAGSSGTKKLSIERFDPAVSGEDIDNWQSNLVYISSGNDSLGNPIFGTPRERNSIAYLVNRGDNITNTSVTLTAENSPYVIGNEGLVVYSGGSLRIESGVVVKIYDGSALFIDSPMHIAGTQEKPVTFSRLTSTDFGSEIPVRAEFLVDTSLYGGITLYPGAKNSTITNLHLKSLGSGLVLIETAATVDGLVISNGEFGMRINGGKVSIKNTHIDSIHWEVLGMYDGEMLLEDSTFSGARDGVGVGVYNSLATIDNVTITDTSYYAGLGVYSSQATTTNSTFLGGTDSGIDVYWSSLYLATSTIKQFQDAGISVFSGNLVVSGSTISENNTGINVYEGTASMTSNNISNNTEHGLSNYALNSLEATGNWWGDLTGPYNEIDNPAGLGNSIYGQADFSGWLLEAI
ncbi:hypothetical protein EPO17_03430, partial [Patescibacteria group bacterium]